MVIKNRDTVSFASGRRLQDSISVKCEILEFQSLSTHPVQVCLGSTRSATVGFWKPGRKAKSLVFLICAFTSCNRMTKEGS